ncbi:MAG TPA: MmcQ/YjbR family DNA-binding protein [Actinomycetes bacterium]|nr:MmcQ/YjbR family DNA-binding protein [Actinomycetes bacterium]
MTLDELVAYGLTKPGARQEFPFDEATLVLKVGGNGGRMFLLAGLDVTPARVSLRCWPDEIQAWREKYPDSVGPAAYMRRKPWNSVCLDGLVTAADLREMLDISYDSAVASLPRKHRPTPTGSADETGGPAGGP